MKRIVTLFLAALMVLTMIVSAAGFNFPYIDEETLTGDEVFNSSMVYDRDVEYLFAANGTPTIDGVVDEAWANAFTYYNNPVMYEVRYFQNRRQGWTGPSSTSHDMVRMMWDENNLYILEERFNEVYSPKAENKYENCWSGGDQTNFNILLPTPLTEFGDATSHQIMVCTPAELLVTETVDGLEVQKPAAVGTIAPSHLYGREIDFTSVRPSGFKEYVYDLATGKDGVYAGIKSFTAITETGYLQETVIPWSALSYANLENKNYKGELGGEFGVKMYFYHKGGDGNAAVYHVNQFIMDGTTNTSDWMGHATVKLIDEVSPYIQPDYSWYNAEATEFEIADAADLLGLAYLTYGWSVIGGIPTADTGIEMPASPGNPANDKAKLGEDTETIEKYRAYYDTRLERALKGSAMLTEGKTFKITADIDLNPGYTGAANTRPGNIWYGLLNFAGTLDGQGHTIKGLYNDAMYRTAFYDEMGFCNNLAATGVIKNVTLEGTFIADVEGRLTDGIAGAKADGATVTGVTVTNLVAKLANPDDYKDSEDVTTEQATTEQATTEQVTTEQATTEQATTEQATTEQATTEKATTEQATTGNKTEEPAGGCASVAGGMVVALLALAAAPMICRKKED